MSTVYKPTTVFGKTSRQVRVPDGPKYIFLKLTKRRISNIVSRYVNKPVYRCMGSNIKSTRRSFKAVFVYTDHLAIDGLLNRGIAA